MNLALLPLVALAGGLGAIARFWVTRRIVLTLSERRGGSHAEIRFLPALGTAVVNLLGAFGAGLLLGVPASTSLVAPAAVAGVGLLGAFTTFSAWMAEVVDLWQARRRAGALLHLFGTLAAGLLLAALGFALANGS